MPHVNVLYTYRFNAVCSFFIHNDMLIKNTQSHIYKNTSRMYAVLQIAEKKLNWA